MKFLPFLFVKMKNSSRSTDFVTASSQSFALPLSVTVNPTNLTSASQLSDRLQIKAHFLAFSTAAVAVEI